MVFGHQLLALDKKSLIKDASDDATRMQKVTASALKINIFMFVYHNKADRVRSVVSIELFLVFCVLRLVSLLFSYIFLFPLKFRHFSYIFQWSKLSFYVEKRFL